MNTLFVAFETEDPAREETLRRFTESFDAMRFGTGGYAIETELRADDLFSRLQPLLGENDVAYVFTLSEPWIGYGYEAMNDWLHRHLHHATP